MNIKRIVDSPLIIILTVLDVIFNWIDRGIEASKVNAPAMSIFYGTNWFDVVIRLALAYFIWKLYRDFRAYKKKVEEDNKALRKKVRDSIQALDKIMNNADQVLLDLWVESRDRQNASQRIIVEQFHKLGVTGMGTKPEDPEITKYKGKANALLDEQEAPLEEILRSWDEEGVT